MDKKVLRERIRKKQQQMRRRKMMRLGAYVIAVILVVIFVIRGILIPVVNRIGGKSVDKPAQVQAETDQTNVDSDTVSDGTDSTADTTTTSAVNSAARYPLKNDLAKASQMSIGWNENENGKWYQNADGTYFAGGMQEIDGSTYYFDENGYIQTGWISVGFDDYYFNDDGTYDPNTHKPRIALTFDDGPGEYTDELLDCLEANNVKATFFLAGQEVEYFQEPVKRMEELGCEIGNHSYDHPDLTTLSADNAASQLSRTDQLIQDLTGHIATVVRPPYGSYNDTVAETAARPLILWSVDTLDWETQNADSTVQNVMDNASDGQIILMHDIFKESVDAAEIFIPQLLQEGYQLVTVSELAAAKGITLENGTAYGSF